MKATTRSGFGVRRAWEKQNSEKSFRGILFRPCFPLAFLETPIKLPRQGASYWDKPFPFEDAPIEDLAQ